MPDTLKLAEYLLTRLHQLGVRSIHGVPGDFNLKLLDHVEPAGIHWVGNANELNAGYAADGYSRIKGIGALVTTFGVGELSAINAIAGAYAERAPVVHIVGTPPRSTQDARLRVHHTFGDGEYTRFAQMHAHVTVAQASLWDTQSAPEQIDTVLTQCVLHSRPVYIQVPLDLVDAPVDAGRLTWKPLSLDMTAPEATTPSQDLALSVVLQKIKTAKQPMILVDGETRALRIVDDVQNIVQTTNWPTFVTNFSKGLVDETPSNIHGIYRGSYDPKAKAFVDSCDLVLCFGPHFTTTNSAQSSAIPPKAATISFTDNEIQIGEQTYRDIPGQSAVSRLRKELSTLDLEPHSDYHSENNTISLASLSSTETITQAKMWRAISGFLRPGDIVMGETGTASYGIQELRLASHSRALAAVTWLSIGYMLPAAQGAALAQRELVASEGYNGLSQARTILFIGDGSFQMTVQELGTIIREDLDVIVFLLNNDGYTIERVIHGLYQKYNDVARWRYLEAPSFLGADAGVFTARVKTWGDLQNVFAAEEFTNGKGLRMVEIMLDREDVLEGPLMDLLLVEKKAATQVNGKA
ncbi:pyruvate decarboxylase [Cladophialophora yegresii CBS 114405]|uniref:Pyruvate decarboxylase n=1 Tax=Cladophialophora yegresii CBS 114405 TaxID=1182544 RepID=W9WBM6_9EURO|nr:pyruvate decarboxylase [Cladophialophora yegresii CBS 114405]EXJ55939.1 pyruvate decarboxylase [Cladophialophora yegresii CBS 114405]